MKIFLRAALVPAFLSTSLCIYSAPALADATAEAPEAEAANAEDAVPWLYEGSEITVDDSWTYGVLDNGLKYAVKRNGVPPDQVAIRVAVDVGALDEKDDERGYAHLMEHLTFRGSTYVPEGENKRIWQRLGVTFGSDSNAQTGPAQTVYMLDLPNADAQKYDEAVKLLSGMIRSPAINDGSVEAEKSVVLAEKREYDGPRSDLADAYSNFLYQGQRLAERQTIGTVKTLKAANSAKLSSFHDRWYRPDNVVVSIAGDLPAETLEAAVKTYFSDWKVPGPLTKPDNYGDPVASQNNVKLYVDGTAPQMMFWSVVRPWRPVVDNWDYNEQLMANELAVAIINRRLEQRAKTGGNFLSASVSTDRSSRSVDETSVTIIPAPGKWAEALADVRAFIADATNTPPSQIDVDREIGEFDQLFQTAVDNYDFENSADAADDIVSAVNIMETTTTPMVALDFFRKSREEFTPKRLLDTTKALFKGDVSRLFATSPKPIEEGEAGLAAAFTGAVDLARAERREASDVSFADLPKLGEPGKDYSPTAKLDLGLQEIEAYRFANGVSAVVWPNKGENERINVVVRFGHGNESFSSSDDELAWSGSLALVDSGIGDLGASELEDLLTGRRVEMNFAVEEDSFWLYGHTRPEELDEQMELLATKLADPNWDPQPLERIKTVKSEGYRAFDMSATAVLSRDLDYLLSDKDPRFKEPTPDDLKKLTADKFREVWEQRLASGPIEVLLIGDFDKEKGIEALSRTFGALKPRAELSRATSVERRFPEPTKTPVTEYHLGAASQAAAVVAWPTSGGRNYGQQRVLEILAEIFRDRLFETFRAQEGASYSPSAYSYWPDELGGTGYFATLSTVRPEDVPKFLSRAEAIAKDIRENGVTEDELKRAVEPKVQSINRSSTGNGFWVLALAGISQDPRRMDATRSLFNDYERITPEDVKAAAELYFDPAKAWEMQVLPKPGAGESSH